MLQCANNNLLPLLCCRCRNAFAIISEKLNFIWLIVSACMVFFMQVGFTAFEAGLRTGKNAISVAVKNILGFLVSSIMYFLLGFGIMFGASYEGYLGTSNFLFFGIDTHLTSLGYAFVFFQLVFASTAAIITSGAFTERAKLSTHICTTIFCIALFILFWPLGMGKFISPQPIWLAWEVGIY